MQPRTRLAWWAASAHCQDMLSFSFTITPKYFSPGLLSVPVLSSSACIDNWDCHNPCAGPFTWPRWTSGIYRPNLSILSRSLWQPFPPAWLPHHGAWSHQQTCWGCAGILWPCHPIRIVLKTDLWRLHSSLLSTWTLRHWPQLFKCDLPVNSSFREWFICQTHISPV